MDYPLSAYAPQRESLVDRLANALVIDSGARSGYYTTAVSLDHRIPDLSHRDDRARWRLATARRRLTGFDGSRAAIEQWHRADPAKGRRLVAGDLANQNRAAAILSWHFEPRSGRDGRPHLITSLGLRTATKGLRADDLVAAWLLTCVALAIDRRSAAHERVGVVIDNAIDVERSELSAWGFRKGPRRGGYSGAYYELKA
jgi:hypothetical protein